MIVLLACGITWRISILFPFNTSFWNRITTFSYNTLSFIEYLSWWMTARAALTKIPYNDNIDLCRLKIRRKGVREELLSRRNIVTWFSSSINFVTRNEQIDAATSKRVLMLVQEKIDVFDSPRNYFYIRKNWSYFIRCRKNPVSHRTVLLMQYTFMKFNWVLSKVDFVWTLQVPVPHLASAVNKIYECLLAIIPFFSKL